MDSVALTGLPTAKSPPPAMLRERAAGGQDLAMDNPPLTGKGHINKNKKPPQSVT